MNCNNRKICFQWSVESWKQSLPNCLKCRDDFIKWQPCCFLFAPLIIFAKSSNYFPLVKMGKKELSGKFLTNWNGITCWMLTIFDLVFLQMSFDIFIPRGISGSNSFSTNDPHLFLVTYKGENCVPDFFFFNFPWAIISFILKIFLRTWKLFQGKIMRVIIYLILGVNLNGIGC